MGYSAWVSARQNGVDFDSEPEEVVKQSERIWSVQDELRRERKAMAFASALTALQEEYQHLSSHS